MALEPATHYELFAGLRAAPVAYLVTGATALVLHGVPRLTPDIELAVDPDPGNLARLERLFASSGYGRAGSDDAGAGGGLVRFVHPRSALAQIDIVVPAADEFARLLRGSAVVTLVDVPIPVVGAADLEAVKEQGGSDADREDAAGLRVLRSVRSGETGDAADTRREQIRKFSRWSVAARLDWLLAAARLAKGMSPEARPLTRGLRRRWDGRR